ncbi:hypothetical protein [Jatrophihabitans sp.]|uniref:hypothetical protein n=1 Tax=Jatrophihabitans sp. TaxID=1932789 RepID=UPI002F0FF1DA
MTGPSIAAASATTITLVNAMVAAAVSLLVAVGTQVTLSVRDSHARRYLRRRAALTDAQDAALALRGRVGEYGALSRANAGRPSPELEAAERRYLDARALLEVALSRVDDPAVVAAAQRWHSAAEVSFISTAEVSAAREQLEWQAVNAAIGSALRSKEGTSAGY